jgi:hypothetical protein
MEAIADELSLHILKNVDQGQERVYFDDYKRGEERADKYVGDVLRWRRVITAARKCCEML